MANQELLQQIQEKLSEGMTEEQIRAFLVSKNWPTEDINGALAVSKISDMSSLVGSVKTTLIYAESTQKQKTSILTWLVLFIFIGAAGAEIGYWYEHRSTISIADRFQRLEAQVINFLEPKP